jgi:protein-S-isoprenylcysteine O-methyltransferase Ste14
MTPERGGGEAHTQSGTGNRQTAGRRLALFVEAGTFTVLVPGTVTYWLPKHALGLWSAVPPRWTPSHAAASLLLGLGLGIYFCCLKEFVTRGRGIPAPVDHPTQLVVTGLYRRVRNPMYLGVLLVLLGEALFFQSGAVLLYALAWLVLVHAFVVLYEEPMLARKFGNSYGTYRRHVRRWVPGRKYLFGPDGRV